MFPLGQEHEIYAEECGNSQGLPVLFIHGGPGSGCNENHRRYFNPEKYRIILFDQRGCNRSTPQGSTANNTTQDLLNDMELIREYFHIEKWLIFGGSWGATLGLLYAELNPENMLGMILRGTFLARNQDLDWFAKDGVNHIFPDEWEKFCNAVPEQDRGDLIDAYYNYVAGDDEEQRQKYAKAWARWVGKIVTYTLENDSGEEEDIKTIVNEVSIETHYAKNHYFIEENQILDQVNQLPNVPIVIIHGRRDLTCPLQSSWALHHVLPQSKLIVLPNAGHLAGEPAMIDALVTATDDMTSKLE